MLRLALYEDIVKARSSKEKNSCDNRIKAAAIVQGFGFCEADAGYISYRIGAYEILNSDETLLDIRMISRSAMNTKENSVPNLFRIAEFMTDVNMLTIIKLAMEKHDLNEIVNTMSYRHREIDALIDEDCKNGTILNENAYMDKIKDLIKILC